MKKAAKVLMGIQIGVLMTTVALPVQAALIIGAPRQLSGSVITLKSSAPVTTPAPAPAPVPTPAVSSPTNVNIGPLPSNKSGNVISLKNYQQTNTVPVTPSPAPVTPTNQTGNSIPPVSALTADEQLMVDMINQERIAAGLNSVIADLRLTAVGRAKANDMKVNNYFSHTSPTYGSPWAMMQQAGITVRWAGENISGNKSVAASMAALMQSPGHKANILDPRFTHVGVGIAYGSAYGNLYVQEFLQQ
ncbi:CAP domain-containing protein [Desulfosporosinus sp.]|uniref:CAP domain-containing protein n=1 Tax=Desulfosporosinus sp. TaxID=157907 RepID=UPI00230E7356|nr:CAP domain-containing protein [Desulfosporosinus sp.]MCO5388061.1 CAP domain-containing protein [Desulfosporosinus sp.]MDA8222155.1 CAP domain-containing protein [Desulfitobacterium hafniense]